MSRYRPGVPKRGIYRSSSKSSASSFIGGLFKVGASMASAYQKEAQRQKRQQARSVAAYNRLVTQYDKEQARRQRQHEMNMRRAEREREKAERERERALRLQAKMQEQQRLEDEISQIEDDNYLWTNVQTFIDDIITLDKVNETIEQCDNELLNYTEDGFFETPRPSNTQSKIQAQNEADQKYNVEKAQKEYFAANKEYSDLSFEEIEPTIDSVSDELAAEAKDKISSFFPWKQSKLRKEYVAENIDGRFKELHDIWLSKKNEYEAKKQELKVNAEAKEKVASEMRQAKTDFVTNRTKELFEDELNTWETERKDFYDNLRQSLQNVIDGDRDYVITAISSLFPDEDLPMEYFVDFAYVEEDGKVLIDLDLPEIEDLPDRKIVLTPTGKKSIRMKGQSDLRSDYSHCVFGLAIYVAHSIFNISLKIQEIEISGYTQRKENNSAVATDQYVFVVSFTRDLFAAIDFNRLSSVQIMDFFQHHYNMTKSSEMKQIDLATAYDKMESFAPADYQSFIATLPPQDSTSKPNTTSSNHSPQSSCKGVNDAPIETFEKASRFMNDLYRFVDRLSKDYGVNRHADNLNGVNIKFTSGNFTGDGNTSTYRGKLFFCTIVDMYRSLEKMRINLDAFTPACYPFALYIIKIYMQKDIQYSMLGTYEPTYHPYIDMLKPMKNSIPVPPHFYLIGEVLCDYEKDMSWYKQYMDLMERLIGIVRDSIQESSLKLKHVDDFLNYHQSFSIGSSSSYTCAGGNENDVDLQHLDPMFEEAARLMVKAKSGSTSLLQRNFSIGYNRAGRLMDQMEAMGIVGPAQGSAPRNVLITDEATLESLLSTL